MEGIIDRKGQALRGPLLVNAIYEPNISWGLSCIRQSTGHRNRDIGTCLVVADGLMGEADNEK